MNLREKHLAWVLAAGWGAWAVNRFSINLGRSLHTWDEEIYFNAAQNVLAGRWLLPRFALESHPLEALDPFLHKPPLVYWIEASAMALGGEVPGIARWPSVIAMSGVVALTVLLAWHLSGMLSAAVAGYIVLHIPALRSTHAANHVATDPFLLLFGFAAVFSLVEFVETEDSRWAWASGIGYGLAIMSKGVAAAPFGLFVLPYLYRYRKYIGWRGFGRIIAGGIIITAPWFLIAAVLAFEELINQMFLQQVVGRATGERFVETPGIFSFMRYPYFQEAPEYFGWPLWLLVPAGCVTAGRFWFSRHVSDVVILMWPLAVGVIGLYALIGGNHSWYIMPAAIPIAVLAADAIGEILFHVFDVVGAIAALRLGPG